MSEEALLSPLIAIAQLEMTIQKPFIDAGVVLPPTPTQLLLSMFVKPEEEGIEELPEEVEMERRAMFGEEEFIPVHESAKRIQRIEGMRVRFG